MSISSNELFKQEIENRIFTIRGKQVMLDSHLAELYGVELKRLNEQVKRNSERFPEQFMFQLTRIEFEFLRSQFSTLKTATFNNTGITENDNQDKHRKHLPYTFTGFKKWFAFSRLNSMQKELLEKLNA